MRSHLPRILSQEEGMDPTGHLFLPSCTRFHQHIARQREDFHYKTAHKLVEKYDLIAVVDAERGAEGRP